MLLAGEPLLFGSTHERAVRHEGCGGVVEVTRDSEDERHATAPDGRQFVDSGCFRRRVASAQEAAPAGRIQDDEECPQHEVHRASLSAVSAAKRAGTERSEEVPDALARNAPDQEAARPEHEGTPVGRARRASASSRASSYRFSIFAELVLRDRQPLLGPDRVRQQVGRALPAARLVVDGVRALDGGRRPWVEQVGVEGPLRAGVRQRAPVEEERAGALLVDVPWNRPGRSSSDRPRRADGPGPSR